MNKKLLYVFAAFLILSCNKDKITTDDTAALLAPIVYDQGARFVLDEHQAARFPNYLPTTPEEKDKVISSYWQGQTHQKSSEITTAELELMYALSDNKDKIMIHVANIEDKDNVKIEWLPYNTDLMEKSAKTPNYYFIYDRKYFDGQNNPVMPNGIKHDFTTDLPTNRLSARLGKKGKQVKIFIEAFNVDESSLKEMGKLNTRSMPGGSGGGVEIPP